MCIRDRPTPIANLGQAIEQIDVDDTVLGQDGDAVALDHAQASQVVSRPIGAGVQLAIGVGHARFGVEQADTLRGQLGALAQQVGDVRWIEIVGHVADQGPGTVSYTHLNHKLERNFAVHRDRRSAATAGFGPHRRPAYRERNRESGRLSVTDSPTLIPLRSYALVTRPFVVGDLSPFYGTRL